MRPDKFSVIRPIKQIETLNKKGFPLGYVGDGDWVDKDSSQKSAANNLVIWFMGNNIPFIHNKRNSSIVFSGKISAIFLILCKILWRLLPIEVDVTSLNMGDMINISSYMAKSTAMSLMRY
ncbi:MAG: hypothetical protein ACTS73_01395 [Arsenophonus sp. NEOnobi-MAG3]